MFWVIVIQTPHLYSQCRSKDNNQDNIITKKNPSSGSRYLNENGAKFSKRVENTVGKGEISCYMQFLLLKTSVFERLVLQTNKSIGLFRNGLTLYHTILTFNDPKKEAFWKHCGKRRKCWKPAFSPFPTMLSTLPKANFKFSVTFILSSANYFNLDQSKILSFGRELTLSHASPSFYMSTVQVFWKHSRKRRNCS